MELKREKINLDVENDIITALITSTPFIRRMLPKLSAEIFESDTSRIVFRWCSQWFSQYNEAPGKEIARIFREQSQFLDQDKADLVSEFLSYLSDNYDEKSVFNYPYRIDKTVEFVKRREVALLSEIVQQCVEMELYDKAEKAIQEYKKPSPIDEEMWMNPFDPKTIRRVLFEEDEDQDELLTLPGALGKLMGPLCRGYLIAILAPMKRGKSYMLQEIALRAARNKKRSVYFSFEMSEERIHKRFIKSLLALGKKAGDYRYPTFDCLKNQDGSCKLSQRKNKITLLKSDGSKPEYSSSMRYKPCTACRGSRDYVMETWFRTQKINAPKAAEMTSKSKSFLKMYGDRIRVKTFPSGSLNVQGIKNALDALKAEEGFEADLILIDYPKLMKPEYSGLTGIESIDRTWIALKGLSFERKVCVVCPTQGTRASIDKKNVNQKDLAGYIDILAHVDVMIALSQTPKEKNLGTMRVSVIAHRDQDFDENRQVVVLQQRGTGQTYLDSEFADNSMPDETTEET